MISRNEKGRIWAIVNAAYAAYEAECIERPISGKSDELRAKAEGAAWVAGELLGMSTADVMREAAKVQEIIRKLEVDMTARAAADGAR